MTAPRMHFLSLLFENHCLFGEMYEVDYLTCLECHSLLILFYCNLNFQYFLFKIKVTGEHHNICRVVFNRNLELYF